MTKRLLILLPALLLAVCCNSFRTETYTDGMAMPLAEGSVDSLLIDINLEYVVKGLPEEVMQAMNGSILSLAFDQDGSIGPVEDVAIQYRDNLIDEYFSENGEAEQQLGFATWVDNINGMFTGSYKDWRNYQMAYYSYRGGIHGVQTVTSLVLDTRTGAALTEADLFVKDASKPLADMLRKRIVENLQQEDATLADLVEQDWVTLNGNFTVGTEGVQWFFQPYEIGPYVLGVVSATLSWEELKPYLK